MSARGTKTNSPERYSLREAEVKAALADRTTNAWQYSR